MRHAWAGKTLVLVGPLGKSANGLGPAGTVGASIFNPPYTQITALFDALPPSYELVRNGYHDLVPVASDGTTVFLAYIGYPTPGVTAGTRVTLFDVKGKVHKSPQLLGTSPDLKEADPYTATFHLGYYVLVGRIPPPTEGFFLAVFDKQLKLVLPVQTLPIAKPVTNALVPHVFSYNGDLLVTYARCTVSCPGPTDMHLMRLKIKNLP